jgi:hypothetical protein
MSQLLFYQIILVLSNKKRGALKIPSGRLFDHESLPHGSGGDGKGDYFALPWSL